MKTIGLIGGMSWESSALYYQIINRRVQQRLGGVHSCRSLLYSVDFDEIAHLQHQNEWDKLGDLMADAAQRLERGGADFIVLCTNTMHKLAENIENSVRIPLLHIADATADAIQQQGLHKVGLLGTRFTMEQDFLKSRFAQKHGIETLVPDQPSRDIVHRIVYEELVKGVVKEDSRREYLRIIGSLQAQGAEGIILGCTEICLLVTAAYCDAPLLDTTTLHAERAVDLALSS
jgi:aspartate racemase